MMEQSSDRNRRRRASLVSANASASTSSSVRPPPKRTRQPALRGQPLAGARPATRAAMRVVPAQRWRPRLVLVASNATPRASEPRPRPELRLLPPLPPLPRQAVWRTTAFAAADLEAHGRRRTAQALLLASMAAAGLAALATSLGRLLAS